MTHAEYLDPNIATDVCTAAELEVVLYRNQTPPMSWSQMVRITGKSKSTLRSSWANANRKVRGGYMPATNAKTKADRDRERAIAVTDPDIIAGLRGMPTVGLSRPGAGIVPGRPTRSGKV